MMKFSDITADLRDVYALRFEPEGARSIADIYWRTLIVIAGIFVVLSLSFGVWNFVSITDTLTSLADTSPPPPAAFNSAQLHGVTAGFDARQTQFDTFTSAPPPILSDPSK